MSTIPVALQLYTLREDAANDFVGTLRQVAAIGYAGVEFAGNTGGLSAEALKALLDELGLQAAGTHAGIGQLEDDLNAVIDYQLAIGNRFVTCPGIPEEMRNSADAWKRTAARFNAIGETLAGHGLTFCYHNHAAEFDRYDGQNGLEWLYGNSDPRFVKAELDLYWAKKGGSDPVACMRQFADRLPLLHIKDMAADADGSFAEIGEGILDWDSIFPAAAEIGVQWHIVEQDTCQRPCLESVAISMRNLKARGLA